MKKIIAYLLIVLFFIFFGYHIWQRQKDLEFYRQLSFAPNPVQRELPAKNDQKVIRILAISGGGIYGIIPAHVLAYIEKATGKPISQSFDLMMGTSTGAIPVVLLTAPDKNNKPRYTAEQVLYFYNHDAQRIFSSPLYHKVLTLNGLVGSKYLTKPRFDMLDQYIGPVYFDQLLNNVVIPAYGLYESKPLLFYNWKEKESQNDNFLVNGLLLGAISPPSIFPAVLMGSSQEHYALVDGALFSNNPALGALLTAMTIYPNKHYVLVSIGTGEAMPQVKPDQAVNWGLFSWAMNLLPISIDGTGKYTNMILHRMSKKQEAMVQYYYFNIPVSGFDDSIDNIAPWNIRRVNKNGEDLVKQSKPELDELAQKLNHPENW